MQFTTAAILGLAAQCAPNVAPSTIAAVVHTESRGYQFAIGVNGLARQPARPSSAAEAIRLASYYVSKGYSVDLGLGQINSRNMRWLGLTWDTVFDPCTNIAAAGKVLAGNYQTVRPALEPQTALRVALSMYNTGSQSRGFRNGYVGRVLNNAGVSNGLTPVSYDAGASLVSRPDAAPPTGAALLQEVVKENTSDPVRPAAPPPPPSSWDVFAKAEYERAVAAQKGENE
jgi:type IV secretion system protein VirB1